MKIKSATQPFFLLVGDIVVFLFSLWATLLIRYAQLPSLGIFMAHLVPFSLIFAIWVVVYFIYDFYGNQTTILQKKLSSLLVSAHIINSVIALAFFYFIPYFAITPKTTLFLFLIVSFILLEWWRRRLVFLVTRQAEETVIFATSGSEADQLIHEFETNPLYQIKVIKQVAIGTGSFGVKPIVVINTHDANTASFVDFYHMLFAGARFVTLDSLYETVFGREPIESISERWFLESISTQAKPLFELGKRLMDLVIGLVVGLISLSLYPFIMLAIKLDDGGEIFIYPERIGEHNKPIRLYKFRTMTLGNDGGHWDTVANKVTRVGAFLRRTRLDELPQLWNVIRGDLSLVGPRPEFGPAVERYAEDIKFYNVRHLVKPGLSGWAQIYGDHPHHGVDLVETKNKLSYDLYYIKHRSILLDIKIALKTIRILLSRSGV
ncbi:MAG: hypothetical protein A2571_03505 [Candidatus Vogelbacteria bacterium RIFOXYD1_FULL_44_32]|uniref:Bacterial sugar transferase domain-containing protein n=1 Tax=Candidatus Vogelbacteria bacterium RIFOXYD1_FULL_44_32 TaxID=1802438 RepID=A0A1G2QES4_9BACT|nr:MAG: hypothetical protein A2571_03505 [Candidatus Vogelbacteria bacterium RIFOXYD1_FULL_44_32]